MSWEAKLLGRVELLAGDVPCGIGGPKPQLVVAALAMAADRAVQTDRLIDLLWGDRPPAAARRTLQAHISKVRLATQSPELIEPEGDGYVMRIDRSAVDLLAWHDRATASLRLVEGDPWSAADQLGDLAARWEPPFGGLRTTDEMAATLAPYHALRDQVVEGLVTAQIDAGEALAAVRHLQNLTSTDATNEALWFQLARGLAQLDRRSAALDAVRCARTALRDGLGLDLGARLTAFELTLLGGPDVRLRNDNLRPQPNEFVDRPEVAHIGAMLAPSRVTTIVGPGGIGKSRCADAIARSCIRDGAWRDGVWIVDLAALPEHEPSVTTAVASAIGLGRDHTIATGVTIGNYLGDRRVLLVLDNCEHVWDAVRTFIGELFSSVRATSVLATSRLRLAIDNEQTIVLATLSEGSSRELFEARVAEAGAGPFPVEDIETLCRSLGHYPLAVELAAARTRALSPVEITERLSRQPAFANARVSFASSDGAGINGSQRNASFGVALDWSLDQLLPHTLSTLQSLTVFPSDFDLVAAESILGGDGSGARLLDDLGVLVEHHLVTRDHQQSRFRLLEPIRQTLVAREPLSTDLQRRHAEYYAAEANRIGTGIFSPDEARCWDRMHRELPQLRDAVRWAADHRLRDLVEQAMAPMASVVAINAYTAPGEWADDALDRLDIDPADVPWTALAAAAGRIYTNRPDQCDALLDHLERSLTEPRMLATLQLVRVQRDQLHADRWLDELEELATIADDKILVAAARIRRIDPDAIAFADRHTNPSMQAIARLYNYARMDDSAKATGLTYVEDFYRIALTSNCAHTIALTQILMGTILCRTGDTARGVDIALDSIEQMCRLRSPHQVWNVIEGMANLLVIMKTMPSTAAALWAAVDATEHPPMAREFRDPARPIWVNNVLTDHELAAARSEGARLSMDEAVAVTRKAIEQLAATPAR